MCANYKRTKTHEIEFTSLEVYYKTALIERPKEKEKKKKKGKINAVHAYLKTLLSLVNPEWQKKTQILRRFSPIAKTTTSHKNQK